MKLFARCVVFCVFAAAAAVGTGAHALDAPKGDVILTVSGEITGANASDSAQFDLELLQNLGSKTFKTSTIWTSGVQTFTGVQLVDLLHSMGVTKGTMRASAINDYSVDIPVSDAVDGGPIIAYEINGSPMSIRDKGPLWIVYPYDGFVEYKAEQIYSRSIWQLDRIEILP
ncbi:MAG: molybdopterin-dependent oxidoreductase [Rhizobiaceae bacterium]